MVARLVAMELAGQVVKEVATAVVKTVANTHVNHSVLVHNAAGGKPNKIHLACIRSQMNLHYLYKSSEFRVKDKESIMNINEHTLDNFIHDNLKKRHPEVLYHYCNKNAAPSILEKGIYCTNSICLDDQTECKLGWEFAKENLDHLLEKELVNKVEELRKKSAIRFWTFSLCKTPNSSYMKDLGYGEPRLEFEYDEVHAQITQLMQKDLMPPLQQLHFFLPCFYLNEKNVEENDIELVQKLCTFIFREYLNDCLIKLHNGDEKKKGLIATACSLMFDAIIKDAKFKEEQEWRIIVITFDDNAVNCCKFGGKCRLHSGLSYRPRRNPNY